MRKKEPIPEIYVCTDCLKACNTHFVDFGIGPYEFWGQKHHDKCVQEVSECCDAPFTEFDDEYILKEKAKRLNAITGDA